MLKISIYNKLKESIEKYGDKPALSTKDETGEYKPISYNDLGEMIDNFASGLMAFGIEPKGDKEYGDRIAIMSENRTEFIVADLANYAMGNITVPIYTTYTPKKIREILEDSGARTVIVSTEEHYKKILEMIAEEIAVEGYESLYKEPFIKNLITMDFLPGQSYAHFEKILGMGKENPQDIKKISKHVKKHDIAVLMYTSGTTGKPKGAMQTHNNITSNIEAMEIVFPEVETGDRALSIIPYSHAFEHTGALTLLYKGLNIGFSSTTTIAKDFTKFKPNIMLAVPRLYEKTLEKIKMNMMDSKFKQKIFNMAMKTRGKYNQRIKEGKKPGFMLSIMDKRLDSLVFAKIREKTGGQLKFCVTGGGPLTNEIEDLFTDKIGIALYNGYGLTETAPVASVNTPRCNKKGTIGKPIPEVDIKIVEGEIAIAGPNIFKGYWNDEEKTKKAFKKIDGKKYFLTGDKGHIDEEGYICITGRMKNDIRLSTGQNIGLAEELEEPLKGSLLINQVMIHGQSEPYIVGLIIPNFEYFKATTTLDEKLKDAELEKYFKNMQDLTPEHPMNYEERIDFAANSGIKELLSKEIDKINKELGLEDYASLKKFSLLPCDFSETKKIEVKGKKVMLPDLLTPTLKIKRDNVLEYYKDLFDKLYEKK